MYKSGALPVLLYLIAVSLYPLRIEVPLYMLYHSTILVYFVDHRSGYV